MSAYVVMPINYEYNDETYNAEGYGKPKSMYTDRQNAEDEAFELTRKELQGTDLNRFFYSISDVLNVSYSIALTKFAAVGLTIPAENQWEEFVLPKELSTEQVKVLLEVLNLEFFVVVEVQVK